MVRRTLLPCPRSNRQPPHSPVQRLYRRPSPRFAQPCPTSATPKNHHTITPSHHDFKRSCTPTTPLQPTSSNAVVQSLRRASAKKAVAARSASAREPMRRRVYEHGALAPHGLSHHVRNVDVCTKNTWLRTRVTFAYPPLPSSRLPRHTERPHCTKT